MIMSMHDRPGSHVLPWPGRPSPQNAGAGDVDGVPVPVGVPVDVCEAVLVVDGVFEGVGVLLRLVLGVPVCVRDGVIDAVLLGEARCDSDDVGVFVGVCEGVGVLLGVIDGVPVFDGVAVMLGEAPVDSDGVGVAVAVVEPDDDACALAVPGSAEQFQPVSGSLVAPGTRPHVLLQQADAQ
jgi:hypothetical protein